MCSISTVVGLDKSGQNASTLMSLLKLFLHSLFLLSIQYPDELLCKIKNLPLLIEYCCCWSRWWNSLYRIWAFAAITDIFSLSLSLSLSPNSFLFKKKRNKEGLKWYLLGWLVMRKLEENHSLVIVMGLWKLELVLGSKSNLLELGLGRGVSWSRYFFYFTKYYFIFYFLRLLLGSKIRVSDNGWIESLSARWVGDGKAKRAWGPPMESLNWIFLSCLAHFSFVFIFYIF